MPQFPREVRQLPALTFLAAGRFQGQEQPQEEEEEAAGRHGGRQSRGLSGSGGAAERGPSSQGAALWARRPPTGMSGLVNYQTY